MRILHTADWHLCDRLGRIDRTDDLKSRVERVAAYAEEHAVELILIAGDLFYEHVKNSEVAASLLHIQQQFQPFFQRGGTMVAISGNHDDDAQLEVVRSGLMLAQPLPSGGVFARGRFYLQNGLTFATFHSANNESVQLVLVPYPRPVRFGLPEEYRTREEEHRLMQHKMTEWTAELRASEKFNKSLPTILMGHLHVRGANLNRTLFRVSEADDVIIEPADLSAGWAYVALGHIHIPQMVNGAETIRYPGPLDRLDFGEETDARGVLLLNLGPIELTEPPLWLPIEPTPMHTIRIENPDDEIPKLEEQYPDRATALVRCYVEQPHDCKLSRDEIARKLRHTFPRLHQINWTNDVPLLEKDGEASASAGVASSGKPFAETVRSYLATNLAEDPDREAILALADTFLETPGE